MTTTAHTAQPPSGYAPASTASDHGTIRVATSILTRAKAGDKDAITAMFQQFVDPLESIHFVEYLGRKGLLTGQHSFGCLTQRRVASIIVGSFGEVVYSDGYLEDVNSSVFYQPSLLRLYVMIAVVLVGSLWMMGTLGSMIGVSGLVASAALGGLLLFYAPTLYYRISKSGLVFVVREGVSVYMFTNRNRLAKANSLWRIAANARDARLRFARV